LKIAVDAMGGDHAPEAIVAGVAKARDQYPHLEFLLYGKSEQISKLLTDQTRIKIIQADEVIGMNDEPVRAIRRKKQSSLVLAAQAVKSGEADALFSCGNTGALLTAGLLIVGRIKGIVRPGLLSTLPMIGEQTGAFNLLDSGANAENKAEHLHQYAILGKYYAQKVRGIADPRIGLLNNGTEPHKGSKITQEAYQLLQADPAINFVGNVEANSVLRNQADVIVADGFMGNTLLKSIEGTASAIMHLLKETIMNSGVSSKLGAVLLKPAFKQLKAKINQAQYGGAVLLGVKAPVVKAHGASDAETVYYTLGQIEQMLKEQMIPDLVDYFSKLNQVEKNKVIEEKSK
jgi:glycerol-3-phosphate acyltransferase PlsX